MAKKITTVFFCQECGHESAKWMGQCPACKKWNTFVEEKVSVTGSGMGGASKTAAVKEMPKPVEIGTISLNDGERVTTGIEELDRVLGGGIMQGSLILVGGDPGIGKSTLLLQTCRQLSLMGKKVLYISGEESLKQIKLRAMRIGEFRDNMLLLCETNLGLVEEAIQRTNPEIVIIDSIQTMYQEEVSSAPGSVSQVREATNVFLQLAKKLGISIFIVGHVTKEGTVAGPRVLEHMVDTVLYFEGDRMANLRLLRAIKNRFGSTNELGVFEMTETGLHALSDPSAVFLTHRDQPVSGAAVGCVQQGARPVLLEIQALTSPTSFGNARRLASGFDYNRMLIIIAVLEKKVGLNLGNQDIYVNITGGLRVDDPAVDLAVAAAIASAYWERPLPADLVAMGEIGLTGELRPVSQPEQRFREAVRLGFDNVVAAPLKSGKAAAKKLDLKLYNAANLQIALSFMGLL